MAENIITDMIPNVNGAQILNWIMIGIIVLLAVISLSFFLWWQFKKKRYKQYKVEIFDRDVNGNVYKDYDNAGVFLDKKTNMRLLFLEKYKAGLNPNKIPFVSSRDSKGRIIKTIYLRRVGVNRYVFLHVTLDEKGVVITVGEEDLNTAAHEMTKIRKTYDKESWLKKFGPMIAAIIVILLIIVLLIVLLNKFGILATVSDNLLKVTEGQERITEMLYNITAAPSMNPTMPIIIPGG